uniref:Regulator of telomere elongation helicase 1 n=1 Tax=Sander lucioperca TaxID=283035 RepID=A0A8D0AE05_SANLU
MPSLSLGGVTVNFPFPPYDCQVDYMNKVIECLKKKQNGVLESPTGTGKTLCLLCATLAWRESFKDNISARKIAERLGGEDMFPKTPLSSWGTAATDGDTPTYYTDVPKIIYASRTHSQLAQVINELKNTSYRPKVCVLGSREQLCINQEVMRQESNHVKVHMCRAKVSTRSCLFYNNVEEKSTDRDLANNILDVEDLVKFGNKQRVCPYYLSRSLKQQADIIFMPYNYLLDPKSRRAHNIELNGAVVIFDEAHNVEKTCEESTSFDLTPYDVASAITAVDRLLVEQAREVNSSGYLSFDLQSELNMDFCNGVSCVRLSFIYELLERAHLTYKSKTEVYEALEQITGYLAGRQYGFTPSYLCHLIFILFSLFFVYIYMYVCMYMWDVSPFSALLSLQVCTLCRIMRTTTNLLSKPASCVSLHRFVGNILSYWCFSPGFSMQDLVDQGVRCIILTSGTLSPLSSFTSEMRIKFPVTLENSHVIERDQIFVGIIECGPDGVQLSSAFDRRFVPENMASLGSTVANLSRVVPHGLLVFFPSFPLMEKTLDFWRVSGNSAQSPVGKQSVIFKVIDGYYNKVNDPTSKGGTFFAVCRGKASEGLDFADTFGRGVVITGLPFPPKMDPRVILKMQFLDEMSRKKTPGVKYLSGQEWYRQQAFRAVNQAIGRVIRHKEDYGAILLCDQRFKGSNARAQLPSWVRPYVRLYAGFGNVIRDVAQFFRVAQKMVSSTIHTGHKNTIPSVYFPPSLLQRSRASGTVPERGTASRVKDFLAEMKKSLSQCSFDRIIKALQTYKKTDNLDVLLTETAVLTEDANTHSLLRGLYQFIRPHHKKRFDEKCQQLTGKGCGYKPDHSLSVDEKKALMLQSGRKTLFFTCWKWASSQLDVPPPSPGSSPRPPPSWTCLEHLPREAPRGHPYQIDVPATFLADVKKAVGAEKSAQLFQAIQSYKKTDNYETLVTTVVSLFTERDEDFNLLVRFGMFIPARHKKQYKEMVDALIGNSVSAANVPAVSEDQQRQGEEQPRESRDTLQIEASISSGYCDSGEEKLPFRKKPRQTQTLGGRCLTVGVMTVQDVAWHSRAWVDAVDAAGRSRALQGIAERSRV